MSHSVVVFSGEPKFVNQSFFLDAVAKKEEEDDGAIIVHLRPGCCVQKTDEGYAIYVCTGGIHGKPIMVISPDTVLRLEGNHECECHDELSIMELPIM